MSQPSEPQPWGMACVYGHHDYCQAYGCSCICHAGKPSTHGGSVAPESTEQSPKKEGNR